MRIVGLIVFAQVIIAELLIDDTRIYTNPPNAGFEVYETCHITDTGSLQLQDMEFIKIIGDFTNYGEFLVNAYKLREHLYIEFGDTSHSFLNMGDFNIWIRGYPSSYLNVSLNSFINYGTLSLDFGSFGGVTEYYFTSNIFENEGTIDIASPGLQGKSAFGTSSITNNGIIRLSNQRYRQSPGPIIGDGCVIIGSNSLVELDSRYSCNQTFVMNNGYILFFMESHSNVYKVMNFGKWNAFIVEDGISNFVYDVNQGILTLEGFGGDYHIIIGTGYDPTLFEVMLDGHAIMYNREAPEYSVENCKDFPFDDIETESTTADDHSETSRVDESTTTEEITTSASKEVDTTSEIQDEETSEDEVSSHENVDTTTDIDDAETSEPYNDTTTHTTRTSDTVTHTEDELSVTDNQFVSTTTVVSTSYTTQICDKYGKTVDCLLMVVTNSEGVWCTSTIIIGNTDIAKTTSTSKRTNIGLYTTPDSNLKISSYTRTQTQEEIPKIYVEYSNESNLITFKITFILLATLAIVLMS
ncbi:uncharacterized protein SPAPADRAFT_68373 [Spathaspora passalidarum NRRL Y-27907]|uniref:Hyphally-regulated cell wall protein N-terminal domain-containing protein n=1 Tax=Spathaspora passalidarum (strain NRRL Y-27907 / 11-Y1) TaxID=619300 RepID=G3AUG2_SPAPN|nr:uncharacterized protein SPAPADRAFT_68373 [Spathaspora passalidarum NRRL Y-27907]EGW30248.1 hypothetical protein SPAPADRAFT_68373 [Spathaspora passalidarum NRRL Y-27907]